MFGFCEKHVKFWRSVRIALVVTNRVLGSNRTGYGPYAAEASEEVGVCMAAHPLVAGQGGNIGQDPTGSEGVVAAKDGQTKRVQKESHSQRQRTHGVTSA